MSYCYQVLGSTVVFIAVIAGLFYLAGGLSFGCI